MAYIIYLFNRKQCVQLDYVISDPCFINCRVPQCRNLGTQLYVTLI